jgi:hypothetical protein
MNKSLTFCHFSIRLKINEALIDVEVVKGNNNSNSSNGDGRFAVSKFDKQSLCRGAF